MKKTHAIVTGMIAIIILVGALVWPNNDTPAVSNTQTTLPPSSEQRAAVETNEQPAITTIEYSDAGFEPKEITVKQGARVQFINNNPQIPMYVATDPHPEHTDYPEFEAGVVLQRHPQPGENFSFTFDKTGNWSFHNHAQPKHMGTVKVE